MVLILCDAASTAIAPGGHAAGSVAAASAHTGPARDVQTRNCVSVVFTLRSPKGRPAARLLRGKLQPLQRSSRAARVIDPRSVLCQQSLSSSRWLALALAQD